MVFALDFLYPKQDVKPVLGTSWPSSCGTFVSKRKGYGAMEEIPQRQAVFGISVTSELTGVQPQTLRDYEAKGLLEPHRTGGGTRRYSHSDVDRIHQIAALLAGGVNLVGARRVLELEQELASLRAEINELRRATASPRRRSK